VRRRDFIAGALATGAALSVRGPLARAAGPAPWGAYSSDLEHAALPVASRAKNVLEVFLVGGLTPWETFYAVDLPDYGQDAGHMWWTFQEGPDSVAEWAARCTAGAVPLLTPFAHDSLGTPVQFGPFADPLRSRSDIVDRLRIHVMSHDLFPHDAARALAYTGSRIGQPHMAGVGAAVQRFVSARAPLSLPAAYVISDGYDGFALQVGHHPPSCRPMGLRIQSLDALGEGLRAIDAGVHRDRIQSMLTDYAAAMTARLTPTGGGARVRAPVLDAYGHALGSRPQAAAMAEVLEGGSFGVRSGLACGDSVPQDFSGSQLRLAAHLLGLDTTRHVTVVDRAFDAIGTDPDAYDSHENHVRESARKLPYLWERLIGVINEPGEGDPQKIDLDDTLVVVNTEFGRSLGAQDVTGRNHYPTAYVTLMFGGPVGASQRGIVGAIDAAGQPVGALQPAETRAATLTALGINPFDVAAYSSDDVNGAETNAEAAEKLAQVVLGVSP